VNKQIRILSVALLLCYVGLFVKLNQIQLFEASSLDHHPGNSRLVERDFNRPRGAVTTADGVLVAKSDPSKGRFAYQRAYPTGDLFANVVGSYSYLFGSDGVEKQYDAELAGQTDALQVHGYTNLKSYFVEHSDVGNVVLTLRDDVQEAAKKALGDRKGSVVVTDPRSGAILAMWSYPSYDPNLTSSNDSTSAKKAREFLDALPDKPRLAKAYRDRFFPGSTFKVVTSSAGVESGKVTDTSPVYPRAASYTPPGTTKALGNFDGEVCGGALPSILAVSCNSAFAQMGAATLGPQIMVGEANHFGFNATPPIDLPGAAESVFPTDYGKELHAGVNPGDAPVYENTAKLAQASIGQSSVSASPLEMALVASAIADRGTIMVPHVMSEVDDVDGNPVETYQAKVWRTATTAQTADVIRQDMIGVAQNGTATRIQIPGIEVGAKTGTAQIGSNPPRSHAWTIAFAGQPGQTPVVAVSVIVEAQQGDSEATGGKVATPIARSVIQAALTPMTRSSAPH
jgi:peptidoglycan glycosyltransferase